MTESEMDLVAAKPRKHLSTAASSIAITGSLYENPMLRRDNRRILYGTDGLNRKLYLHTHTRAYTEVLLKKFLYSEQKVQQKADTK